LCRIRENGAQNLHFLVQNSDVPSHMGFWKSLLVDYLEHGNAITDLIGKVCDALKEKRRGKLSCRVLFHQDNILAHIRNSWLEILHLPLYSPDLATSDFYLLPKLKEFLRGCKFTDDDSHMHSKWLARRPKTIILNFSTKESILWRSAGPCAYQLQKTMSQNDKMWCTYVVVNCVRL